jgi:hypothetical protein
MSSTGLILAITVPSTNVCDSGDIFISLRGIVLSLLTRALPTKAFSVSLHDKYVIVPADKVSNNIVYVCKSYNYECLITELGINNNTSRNTIYKPTSFDKDEILANHRSFMTSLNIPSGKESEDLPYLYWIPKLHKTSCKERCIAGSSTCSTKELSIHLTKILSAHVDFEKL